MELGLQMFEGSKIAFNVPLTRSEDGCILKLNTINLTKQFSPQEMEQLLFEKPLDKPEIYSRIFFNIYGSPKTITFMISISKSSISTDGLLEIYSPNYVPMKLGDEFYDFFQLLQYYD